MIRVTDKAGMYERSGNGYETRVYLILTVLDEEKNLGLKISLAFIIWGDAVTNGSINLVHDNKVKIDNYQPNEYTDRADRKY